MQNLIPLGTGNSRFMKSNISSSTTLAQLIQMLNNGTFPYDIGTLNPAGISQQGTPLNKDTLLKDATAQLYGLTPSTAVPDDVFQILAQAALYKTVGPTAGLYDVSDNLLLKLPGVQIETGSYVGTGTYGRNNKNSLTFGIEPLVVMVCRSDSSSYASFLNPCKKSAGYQNYGLSDLTWSDKSLSWNNQYNADYQLNRSNTTYYYIAFGF